MHVLAFRHIPYEDAGRLGDVLEARGIRLDYVDLYRPDARLPETAGAAGLVFLGGFMSVTDALPYLAREEQVIRDAAGRGQPVLGLCLGAQLIASALGQRVYRNPVKEVGWFDVHFTEAADGDPLFAGAGPSATVFQWHNDTFDLPANATLLAGSPACRHQAYRLGNIYGLQFHLEVTPATIAAWCQQDAHCLEDHEADQPIDPHAFDSAPLANQVFGRWAGLL